MKKDKEVKPEMQFAATVTISLTVDQLSSAIEAGVEYATCCWATIEKVDYGSIEDDCEELYYCDAPFTPGGYILIRETGGGNKEVHRLDLDAVKRGLKVMAAQYPDELLAIRDDLSDGIVSDMFVQCCLFGKVIYG